MYGQDIFDTVARSKDKVVIIPIKSRQGNLLCLNPKYKHYIPMDRDMKKEYNVIQKFILKLIGVGL